MISLLLGLQLHVLHKVYVLFVFCVFGIVVMILITVPRLFSLRKKSCLLLVDMI